VGAKTTRSFRGIKGVHTKATNVGKSTTRSATHSVCVGDAYCSQRSFSTRKRGIERRQKYITPSPNILCFQSSGWLKEVLLRDKKICYDVAMSVRKLQHYFEDHRVRVLTNQLLNDIFENRDSSGRIAKWAMELSEHVIDFEKRNSIKSQVLVDFIADWTEPSSYTEGTVINTPWQVYCDGA
jgi:hypothetical protein